ICFECGAFNPQWVSVTYGIWICDKKNKLHLLNGTDMWEVEEVWVQGVGEGGLYHLKMGGGGGLYHLKMEGEKVNSSFNCKFYKRKLEPSQISALSEGREWSIETSPAKNWTPPQPKMSLSSSHRSAGLSQNTAAPSDKAFEDWLNDDISSYQSLSGGGHGSQETRYVGFGNTVSPPKKEDDFLNNAMSSLYSGIAGLSFGATNSSPSRKKGHIGGGEVATWVATELGQSLNENVLKPAQEKVKEGKLLDEVTVGVSQLATKVQDASSKGWKEVTSLFSGKTEESSDRPPTGEGYQNSEGGYQNSRGGGGGGGGSYQDGGVSKDFWETFGASNGTRAKKSPSTDSWTCADNSTGKKSSDSWDVWGPEAISSNKNSNSDSWENWENNWEGLGGESKSRKPVQVTSKAAAADDGWDNLNW
uniref:ARF GTPase activating protein 1 n=1 Tax=Latimeria chalumnae TaxID=7897 RepID=H3AXE9_LATCH